LLLGWVVARSRVGSIAGDGPLPDPEIAVRQVARIERHVSTGKLRRFVAITD
jgi:hypothetical protein